MFDMFLSCFLNQAARIRGVDCIVAPYEADAQLAYLTKSGFAQAVITEDSDLLAFGCKKVSCTQLLHLQLHIYATIRNPDILYQQYFWFLSLKLETSFTLA